MRLGCSFCIHVLPKIVSTYIKNENVDEIIVELFEIGQDIHIHRDRRGDIAWYMMKKRKKAIIHLTQIQTFILASYSPWLFFFSFVPLYFHCVCELVVFFFSYLAGKCVCSFYHFGSGRTEEEFSVH